MTTPKRHETRVEDGRFYIEYEDDWLEIGPMDDIVELLGGETYTLEYTEQQAAAAWLNTDDDGTLTIDVRDSITSMSFRAEFVRNLATTPLNEAGDSGSPLRTELFADLMETILESKGNLDES
ncbi:MAG: hypothetical protein ABEI57_00365 [Halapricum sp.]